MIGKKVLKNTVDFKTSCQKLAVHLVNVNIIFTIVTDDGDSDS